MSRARCELGDEDLQAIVLEHVAEIEAMKTEQGDAETTIKHNMGLMGSLMSVTRRVGHVPLTKAILAKTVLGKEQAQKHGKAISYAVSYVSGKERNMATGERASPHVRILLKKMGRVPEPSPSPSPSPRADASAEAVPAAPSRSSTSVDIYSAYTGGSQRRLEKKTPEKKKTPACVDLVSPSVDLLSPDPRPWANLAERRRICSVS